MVFLWKMSLFNDFERLSHRLGPVKTLARYWLCPVDWLAGPVAVLFRENGRSNRIKGRRRGSTPNVPLHPVRLLWRDGRPRSHLWRCP